MRRGLLLALILLVAPGCHRASDEPLWEVPDFHLTERSGQTIQRSDLLGKIWIAAFVFTRCTTSCPQLSGVMARMQHDLADLPDVALVSFSVDPEHDTPQVLSEYAGRFGADPRRWLFLTGDRDAMYRLIREGFHLGVEPSRGTARTPGNEVMHSNNLMVVDRQGRVRAYGDGRNADEVKRLEDVVLKLAREKP